MLVTFLAMDTWTLITFLGASALLFLTPGSDMMFAIASGMSGGPKVGLAAAAGIALGMLFHVILAAAGLAALIIATPVALDVIRYVGAAYLAYLAYRTWFAVTELHTEPVKPDLGRAFRRGLLTNIFNPKVALFVLAFLPQFTNPAIGPIWQQILILGIILAFGGLIFKSIYGGFAGAMATRVRRHAKLMNKISATVFGGLAARLALS
jgi:threonine/homoserine/homoserine lactone efflux protein